MAEAARVAPGLPLVAGGKSFGGRMTSSAQAEAVRSPAWSDSHSSASHSIRPGGRGPRGPTHLERVAVPMLFLQGTRDEFAELELLRPVVQRLGARATLHLMEGGDHSFKVLKRSGTTDADVMRTIVEAIVSWGGAGGRTPLVDGGS